MPSPRPHGAWPSALADVGTRRRAYSVSAWRSSPPLCPWPGPFQKRIRLRAFRPMPSPRPHGAWPSALADVGTRRRAYSVSVWRSSPPLCPWPGLLPQGPRLRATVLLHPPGKTRSLAVGPRRHYHWSSPLVSGMTRRMASMATSIMLSSGSLVVKRCKNKPGARKAMENQLTCRPTQRLIS